MQDAATWIEQNRPSGNLDYQRLGEVTATTEEEGARVGSTEVLNRRFDYDMALKFGTRRMKAVSETFVGKTLEWEELLPRLRASWGEGFIFGSMAYRAEGRGRARDAFLDRIALANIEHALRDMAPEQLNAAFEEAVSQEALMFVATVRSFKARQVALLALPDSPKGTEILLSGHWLDGFMTGLVFEEQGGHRAAA